MNVLDFLSDKTKGKNRKTSISIAEGAAKLKVSGWSESFTADGMKALGLKQVGDTKTSLAKRELEHTTETRTVDYTPQEVGELLFLAASPNAVQAPAPEAPPKSEDDKPKEEAPKQEEAPSRIAEEHLNGKSKKGKKVPA